MIEKGLYSLLAGTAGVTAIVSTRIYPNYAPQNAGTRYIVYRRVTSERVRHLRGSGGKRRAMIQVECYGATALEAKALWEAVEAAIGNDGFTGTWDGQAVAVAFWEDDSDDFVPPQASSDRGKHVVSADLVVWYEE